MSTKLDRALRDYAKRTQSDMSHEWGIVAENPTRAQLAEMVR